MRDARACVMREPAWCASMRDAIPPAGMPLLHLLINVIHERKDQLNYRKDFQNWRGICCINFSALYCIWRRFRQLKKGTTDAVTSRFARFWSLFENSMTGVKLMTKSLRKFENQTGEFMLTYAFTVIMYQYRISSFKFLDTMLNIALVLA